MELKEKAWVINSDNWDNPYLANDTIYYALYIFQAKSKAFNDIDCSDFKDKWGEPITYSSLKMKRQDQSDKYYLPETGEIKLLVTILLDAKIKKENDALNLLLQNSPENAMAYIRKGGYYYRPNNCGYTEYIIEAGIYPLKEAVSSVRNTSYYDNMSAIVIDPHVHNKMINDKIEELKSKLI